MHDSLAIVVTVSWIRLERIETDRNGGIQGEETRRDLIIRSSVDTSDTLIPGPDTRSSGFFFSARNIARFTRATSGATTLLGGGWGLYLIKPPEAG